MGKLVAAARVEARHTCREKSGAQCKNATAPLDSFTTAKLSGWNLDPCILGRVAVSILVSRRNSPCPIPWADTALITS